VGSYGKLSVGTLVVSRLRDGIDHELLAAFRDDMLVKHQVPWSEYYNEEGGEPELVDVYGVAPKVASLPRGWTLSESLRTRLPKISSIFYMETDDTGAIRTRLPI
jgi:hypothetical protein